MRLLSRLALLLLFAAGLCWPAQAQAQAQLRDGEPPCPSQTVLLACAPDDALAALRALAAADAPCHVKVIEAQKTAMTPRAACEPVVYAALSHVGRGIGVGAIDPPPRS
ncbi:hypothetical protein [Aureimonas mangrovi]|uniref:hypothetical protein n=1 Tax=Aureimonas mangrovi TaxID=2758041 RepID=UPI00163D7251|nr:hypothetical protein [Aureimonas mangrovi]